MNPKFKEKIIKLGGVAADNTHLPLHSRGMDEIPSILLDKVSR